MKVNILFIYICLFNFFLVETKMKKQEDNLIKLEEELSIKDLELNVEKKNIEALEEKNFNIQNENSKVILNFS